MCSVIIFFLCVFFQLVPFKDEKAADGEEEEDGDEDLTDSEESVFSGLEDSGSDSDDEEDEDDEEEGDAAEQPIKAQVNKRSLGYHGNLASPVFPPPSGLVFVYNGPFDAV